jgi:hypothetical protein
LKIRLFRQLCFDTFQGIDLLAALVETGGARAGVFDFGWFGVEAEDLLLQRLIQIPERLQ